MEEIEETASSGAATVGTPAVETEVPAREDRGEVDRSDLVNRVQASLEALANDGTPTDESDKSSAEETAKEGTDEEQPDPDAEEETPGEDDKKEDAEVAATTDEKKPDASAKSAVPTLPAAYVRSLKAYDWTDEEIAEAAKNPTFLATAAKLHNSRNAELSKWAELGRKTREADAIKSGQAPPTKIEQLTPVDVAALKKQYGNEPIIDAMIAPMNRAIEQMNAMLPIVQETQAKSQQAELENLGRHIDGFFGGKEMETYKEMYGLSSAKLSQEQVEQRNKVLEQADRLMVGAKVQGVSLSLGDALQLAHDAVSSGFKEQAVRTTIKKQVKQREKGITLKPTSHKTGAAASGKVNSRSSLESKIGAGLKKAFA